MTKTTGKTAVDAAILDCDMSIVSSTDYWDFYFCSIDDSPHSTLVNLSFFDIAPMRFLTTFHCIEVDLNYPNPENGMTTNEESEVLEKLDGLIDHFVSENLKYVARQTGNNKRKFYFYSASDAKFASLFDSMVDAFPDYTFSTFNFEDAKWETYFGDLYPNEIAMNEIANRQVYDRLEENGDDLSISRMIDHSVLFRNKTNAKAFEAAVKEKGFTVEISSDGFFRKTYDLLVQKPASPSTLDPVTFELKRLTEGYGGTYDGWGCMAVTSSDQKE